MKSWLLGLLALALLGAPLGCGGSPQGVPGSIPAAKSGHTLRMGMMPKLVGISYFNACQRGAQEAARELGVELTFDGPTVDKVEQQVQMIDEWVALGFDVIAVAPNDPEVIAPALDRAKKAGILVLTWDADANPQSSGRATFVNQAPVNAIGQALVDIMADGIGGHGKTVIVTGSATSPNQNAWMKAMEARLKDKYPRITLLETLVPEEDQNRARQMTIDLLHAHPDLAGLWGITSVSLPGAAEGVRQAGRAGKVFVTGLSQPSTVKPYVLDGTIAKFVLWNPFDLGYLTVQVAKRLKESPMPPGQYTFGRLKNIKVTAGEVILGPPMIFDKENVNNVDY